MMHIPLLLPLFDFLMSFLQISPQLIKVKQNSHFRSQGRVMGDVKKMQGKHSCFCNWSVLNPYTFAQNPCLSIHNRWPDRSHLAARSASLKSLECRRLALQKWDDRGVCCNTHYPVNPPVSALPNSLELKVLSPFLRCDNTAILGNSNLTAEWLQTGWKAEQIWKNVAK